MVFRIGITQKDIDHDPPSIHSNLFFVEDP